ncbi:MAG: hypothetical protein HN675_05075 [Opitutae bacterium]|jgi:L-Ala-D/L-Glu epimerase|nr:hypothetical protein [Opitutae bacterium]
MPRIQSACVEQVSIPLIRPYELSFAKLHSFETLLLHLTFSNGEKSVGEVVPLTGYTDETVGVVLATVNEWLPRIINDSIERIRKFTSSQIASHPCASSLVLCAIDAFRMSDELGTHPNGSVPLVFAVSSTNPKLAQTIDSAIARGYKTIKVKIGKDFTNDVKALQILKLSMQSGVKIRFDANQAFSYEEAAIFLHSVENTLRRSSVELVEQPLPLDQWEQMAQLIRETKIPLMLDESIYSVEDVNRAAKIGCKWIKLKLCKQGGINELIDLARHAKSRGLSVVIGNGVATDISNLLELQVYNSFKYIFSGASESNGYLKIKKNLVNNNLECKLGYAIW